MSANLSKNFAVTAHYVAQKVARYQGNPLIEALPPQFDDDQLIQSLIVTPDYKSEQKDWDTSDRMIQVTSLASFMVPLSQHFLLARTLHTLIREGYVGRRPRTAEFNAVFQRQYDRQQAGIPFANAAAVASPQLSMSLIGVSGMGKTTTVRRILSTIPPVIYHPDLQIWQIPYLHIETPHDGASVIGLVNSIFRKIDSLIPDANYYETHCTRRASADVLIGRAATVLHAHCTGLLVCDEIQNLCNSSKTKQSLMSLLVTASNELSVPLLFIGTPKAHEILGLDFRQARRSSGIGMQVWERLGKGQPGQPGEWDEFISVLWRYQWIRQPQPLNQHMSNLMYYHSQGIIDLAIKLFIASQFEAMLDMSETLTATLIRDVAKKQFALCEPILDAIRTNNDRALSSYGDVSSMVSIDSVVSNAQFRFEGARARTATVRPGTPGFGPAVASALADLGIETAKAKDIASAVETDGTANNIIDGTQQALAKLAPTRRRKPELPTKTGNADSEQLEQGDYRRATLDASKKGTTVLQQLIEQRMACDVAKVLGLT